MITENSKISPNHFKTQITKKLINQKIKKKVHFEAEFNADSEKKVIFALG